MKEYNYKAENKFQRIVTYSMLAVFLAMSFYKSDFLAIVGWIGATIYYGKTHLLELLVQCMEDVMEETNNAKEKDGGENP